MVRSLAILLFVGLVAGLGVAGDEPTYRPYLPGTAPENVRVIRVLGLKDGRIVPVARARVTGWSEPADHESPVPKLLCEATTDEDGLANLTWPEGDPPPFHGLVYADGKAVRHMNPWGDMDVHVAKGKPYAFRVLSPLGEPLPGAAVEHYIYGCPHAPATQRLTTDAGGLVTFEGFPDPEEENPDAHNEWGQFWIVAEGAAARRYGADPRHHEGKPVVLLTDPGRMAHGVVTREDGKAAAGVVVRQDGYPRGPFTVTDENGRFRLVGASDGGALLFFDPKDPLEKEPNARVEDFESDVALRVRLQKGRETTDEVRMAVRPALEEIPVRLVRLSDGYVIAGETDEDGRLEIEVPAGRYRVAAGGFFSPLVRASRELDLPSEEPIRFDLAPAPKLVIDGDAVGAEVRTTWGLSEELDVHLPPDEPAVVRSGTVLVPVGPAQDGVRRARIPDADPYRVRLRAVDASTGKEIEDADATMLGDFVFDLGEATIWRPGRHRILFWSRGYEDRTVSVTLTPGDHETKVVEAKLHPLRPHSLRVLHADGTPVKGIDLRWGPRGMRGNEIDDQDGVLQLELGPTSQAGILVAKGLYPMPVRLSQKSPREIRLPGGSLVIRVSAPDSVGYVDHVRVPLVDGVHRIGAVPPGKHRILVGAQGHLHRVVVVDLGENESRTLDVVLPER